MDVPRRCICHWSPACGYWFLQPAFWSSWILVQEQWYCLTVGRSDRTIWNRISTVCNPWICANCNCNWALGQCMGIMERKTSPVLPAAGQTKAPRALAGALHLLFTVSSKPTPYLTSTRLREVIKTMREKPYIFISLKKTYITFY